jgi:2'-5' RNA ligase
MLRPRTTTPHGPHHDAVAELEFATGFGWPDWHRAYRYGALEVMPPDDIAADVDSIRSRFDPDSAAISSAHITLTPPLAREPSPADLDLLAATASTFDRCELTLLSPTAFPDSSVVYLPVEPVAALAELQAAFIRTGLFASSEPGREFTPHMTLSEFGADPQAVLVAAARANLAGRTFPLTHVSWFVPDQSFRFAVRGAFPLGPAS